MCSTVGLLCVFLLHTCIFAAVKNPKHDLLEREHSRGQTTEHKTEIRFKRKHILMLLCCFSACQESPAGTLGCQHLSRLVSDKSWALEQMRGLAACLVQTHTQHHGKSREFGNNSPDTCPCGLLCQNGTRVCVGVGVPRNVLPAEQRVPPPQPVRLVVECVSVLECRGELQHVARFPCAPPGRRDSK